METQAVEEAVAEKEENRAGAQLEICAEAEATDQTNIAQRRPLQSTTELDGGPFYIKVK